MYLFWKNSKKGYTSPLISMCDSSDDAESRLLGVTKTEINI